MRKAVNDAKKDRAKAWDQLTDWSSRANDKYIEPSSRWAKVLGNEVFEATGATQMVEQASEYDSLRGTGFSASPATGRLSHIKRCLRSVYTDRESNGALSLDLVLR